MPRALPLAVCALGALTACAGCGGFSVPNEPDSGSRLPARQLHIGRSAALHPPGGGRLRVTLVSYDPRERERSAREPDQPVAGIELRIKNVGKRPLRLGPPKRYATLLGIDGLGENAMAPASGPCAGPFQSTPIRLAPGKATHGCVPWSYPTNKPPFEFIFAFNKRATHGWILPH
jgi:hypothetical protein